LEWAVALNRAVEEREDRDRIAGANQHPLCCK
jgi:hypothetical protein